MNDEVDTQRRGGRRAGAGRSSSLGPTVRRDLRVPAHIERAAIEIGKGAFSDGMRYMCEEYLRMKERDTYTEPPAQDTPVLIYVQEEERWTIAVAEISSGHVIFREAARPDSCHVADTWRHLPSSQAD